MKIGTSESLKKFIEDYPGHQKEKVVQQVLKNVNEGWIIKNMSSKEETIEVPSSAVGQGTVHFKPNKNSEGLIVEVNTTVPVVNKKVCNFCGEVLKISSDTRVPLAFFKELFKDRPIEDLQVGLVISSETWKDAVIEIKSIPDSKFREFGYILAGPNGAILKKKGNIFYLSEGLAWLVFPNSNK